MLENSQDGKNECSYWDGRDPFLYIWVERREGAFLFPDNGHRNLASGVRSDFVSLRWCVLLLEKMDRKGSYRTETIGKRTETIDVLVNSVVYRGCVRDLTVLPYGRTTKSVIGGTVKYPFTKLEF